MSKWHRLTPAEPDDIDQDHVVLCREDKYLDGYGLQIQEAVYIDGNLMPSEHDYSVILNKAELSAIPPVRALIEAARDVVEGAAASIRSGSCECPACERRAHLAAALAPFKDGDE